MNKTVLYIEDYFGDFEYFSQLMLSNGFCVYPPISEICNQTKLYEFLNNNTANYSQLKENIFKYIIEKELYEKLSLLMLDINLLGEKNNNKLDESGCQLLSDFRNDFYSFAQKCSMEINEAWSKRLPATALTIFRRDKRNEFLSRHGYFRDVISKKEAKNNPSAFTQKLDNWEIEKANDHRGDIIVNKTTGCNSPIITGNTFKTTGCNSPIITGNDNTNIIQSEQLLVGTLKKWHIKQEDADELVRILSEERAQTDNESLILKMKNWWTKIKSYVINFELNVLSNLLVSLYLLTPEQSIAIQAILQK